MNIQPTLMTVLGLSSLIAGAMFLVLSTFARQLPGIRQWAWACGLLGLAMLIDLPPSVADQRLNSTILNLLVSAGQLLYLAGILQFCGRPVPRWILGWYMVAFVLLTLVLTYVVPDRPIRLLSLTMLLGWVHAWGAWILWRHPEPEFRRVYRATGVIMLLQGLTVAAQGVLTVLGQQALADMTSLWGAIVGTMLSTWMLFLLVLLRLVAELRGMAERDTLTGLLNRRGLHQAVDALRQRRAGPGERIAVLLMDIDQFKAINDRHGHEVGDAVLILMGQVLRDPSLSEALACRWGGEEFCVVIECRDPERALGIAEAIRTRFQAAAADLRRLPQGATVSIGVALVDPGAPAPLTAMIAAADAALYRAKTAGRNRSSLSPLPAGQSASPA